MATRAAPVISQGRSASVFRATEAFRGLYSEHTFITHLTFVLRSIEMWRFMLYKHRHPVKAFLFVRKPAEKREKRLFWCSVFDPTTGG